MKRSSRLHKTLAGLAGLALLTVPLAACGGSDSTSQLVPYASLSDLRYGVSTSIKLDDTFVKTLGSLNLTPGVVGDGAELTADGTLVFPVTGGAVQVFDKGSTNQYVTGQIQHEKSGLTLSGGGTTAVIGNFNVDPGFGVVYGDVTLNGDVAATSTEVFYLDGSTLADIQPPNDQGQVTLTGTTVYLSQGGADLLNKAFGTNAAKGGILVGVATIVLGTRG